MIKPTKSITIFWGDEMNGWKMYGVWFKRKWWVGASIAI